MLLENHVSDSRAFNWDASNIVRTERATEEPQSPEGYDHEKTTAVTEVGSIRLGIRFSQVLGAFRKRRAAT